MGKKFVKEKEHKERAQPKERARFGFLEKKKDYKIRARDYARKKKKLNRLKEIASLRNPEEFYFKMNSDLDGGKRFALPLGSGLKGLSSRKKRNLIQRRVKGKDISLLNLINTSQKNRLERNIHNNLHMIKPTCHHHDDDGEFNNDSNDEEEDEDEGSLADLSHDKTVRSLLRGRNAAYRKAQESIALCKRIDREVANEQTKLELMKPGRKFKVSEGASGSSAVFKWKQIRKK